MLKKCEYHKDNILMYCDKCQYEHGGEVRSIERKQTLKDVLDLIKNNIKAHEKCMKKDKIREYRKDHVPILFALKGLEKEIKKLGDV